MKILVKMIENPDTYALIHVDDKKAAKKIRDFVHKGKHAQAISHALREGNFLREIQDNQMHSVEANLTLTRKNARWDLTV